METNKRFLVGHDVSEFFHRLVFSCPIFHDGGRCFNCQSTELHHEQTLHRFNNYSTRSKVAPSRGFVRKFSTYDSLKFMESFSIWEFYLHGSCFVPVHSLVWRPPLFPPCISLERGSLFRHEAPPADRVTLFDGIVRPLSEAPLRGAMLMRCHEYR